MKKCLLQCQTQRPIAIQIYPDSKVYEANMGPTWALSAPGGPHVGPMNLAIMVGLQKVDLCVEGKWSTHGTQHHKYNQPQSLEVPCRISWLGIQIRHKEVPWLHAGFNILKEGPWAEISCEVSNCSTRNT